jgi:xanthine dehydrogenase accessory factor
MAVFDGGESIGSVGGGLLEAQVLAAAEEEVLRSARPVCLTFSLTAKEVAGGGMLCGGRVEVLVDVLEGRDTMILQLFEKIVAAQEEGRGVWLIRSIRPEQSERNVSSGSVAPESALPVVRSSVRTGLGLMDEDNLDAGSLDMTDLTMDTLKQERRRAEAALIASGGVRYLLQPVVLPDRVIIAGAGHVAQELATLCHFLGLRTVVIDDRREFACRERFPAAGEIVISPDSFQDCFLGMEIDGDCCIVIVTRGHEHDRNVLAQALRTGAGYIGMIGSRRKRDAIYRSLRGEGFSPEDLARVRCPIGIAIGARTPAEIAVSIAAELIALRAEKEISPVLIPG